jgi:hypothetical protein
MPRLVETVSPNNIHPLMRPTWKYVNNTWKIRHGNTFLATSGIYKTSDVERLWSHIMFPVEKPSMLNIIARGATHTGGKHLHNKPFGRKISRQNCRECRRDSLK